MTLPGQKIDPNCWRKRNIQAALTSSQTSATCRKCGYHGEISMFRTPHKKGIEGYSYYDYCKKCHVQQSQSTRYKLLYNITSEEYDKILKLQKGRCAICGNFPKNFRLAVDHCHKTGLIRGLLCWRCNNAIGKFNDSQTLIFSAFVYLFSSPAAIALGEKRYGVIGRVSRKAKNRAYGGPNLEEKQHKIDPVKLMEYLKNWWGTEHYASEVYEKPETKKAIIRRTKTRL